MLKLTTIGFCAVAALGTVVPLSAQCRPPGASHPRSNPEFIEIVAAGNINPGKLDLKNGDTTKVIFFCKDGNKPFTITFPSGSPCVESTINEKQNMCTLKAKACPANHGGTCAFSYQTAAGDPDIEIDPGYNGQKKPDKDDKKPAPKK